MLILQRKLNEDIIINGTILVRVIEFRGDKIRLGVEAAPDVEVHRREIYEKIHGPSTWLADKGGQTAGHDPYRF